MSSWADKRSAEEKSYAKYEDNKEYIEKKRKSFQEEVKNKIVSEAKVRESKAEVKALKKQQHEGVTKRMMSEHAKNEVRRTMVIPEAKLLKTIRKTREAEFKAKALLKMDKFNRRNKFHPDY